MSGFFSDLDAWLTSVEAQKTALAEHLVAMGVTAADTESLSALVDKVLNINSGLDSYVKALLHFDGTNGSTTITDKTGRVWTARGNAALATADKAYGTASLALDGTGDYVDTDDSDDFYFGADPFTIDMWMKVSDANYRFLYSQAVDTNNAISVYVYNGRLYFIAKSGGTNLANYYTTNVCITTSVWTHIAVVRNGTSVYLFVNGVSQALTATVAVSTNSIPNLAASPSIGVNRIAGGDAFYGNIDEARISKGIARWTASFVPGCAYGQ